MGNITTGKICSYTLTLLVGCPSSYLQSFISSSIKNKAVISSSFLTNLNTTNSLKIKLIAVAVTRQSSWLIYLSRNGNIKKKKKKRRSTADSRQQSLKSFSSSKYNFLNTLFWGFGRFLGWKGWWWGSATFGLPFEPPEGQFGAGWKHVRFRPNTWLCWAQQEQGKTGPASLGGPGSGWQLHRPGAQKKYTRKRRLQHATKNQKLEGDQVVLLIVCITPHGVTLSYLVGIMSG